MSELSIEEIKQYLPHRYPFLLVDRVLEYKSKDYLYAIKNITFNEPCFTGHFPEQSIYPGVLITEGMAQASALLGTLSMEHQVQNGMSYYLVGVDKARFRKPTTPGDQLRFEIEFISVRRNMWKFAAKVKVDDALAAEAELLTTIVEEKI